MTAPAPEGTPTPAATDGTVEPAAPAREGAITPEKTGRTAEEEVAHWKSMARKNEDAAKANKKAADELAEIKQSQLTDQEKAEASRKALETRAAELESENVRYKAAAVFGISEENFDLLGTGTEEEIMARADRLGELEDAVIELAQLKQQLEAQDKLPGSVPLLTPGAAQAPDTSYPTGWFPGLTRANNDKS